MKTNNPIKFFLLFIFLTTAITGVAQNPSVLGRFEADYIQGCVPFKIILTETDTFPESTVRQYLFLDLGDTTFIGFEPGEEITFSYSEPGTYDIVQIVGIDVTPKTDTLTIEVKPNLQPEFKVFTCEKNGVKIDIAPDQYDQYKVFFTLNDSLIVDKGDEVPDFVYPAGSHEINVRGLLLNGKENCATTPKNFNTIEGLLPANLTEVSMLKKEVTDGRVGIQYELKPDVVYSIEKAETVPLAFKSLDFLAGGSSYYLVDSIDTRDKINLFRIAAYDACQDKYLYSDTMATVAINALAENNQNRVEWNTFPVNFNEYQILRNNIPYETITDRSTKLIIDKNVDCFNTYCYSLTLINRNGGRSLSDTVCVVAYKIFFPPPIRNTTASVIDSVVNLGWMPVDNITTTSFFIQKRVGEDIFATIDSVANTQYVDIESEFENGPFCYTVNYLDECKNRSNIGDLSCTIYLSFEKEAVLNWTEYVGWPNGVDRYFIEEYNENKTYIREYDVGKEFRFEIKDYIKSQLSYYRIRAEGPDNPGMPAYSNFVVKEIESVLWFPNSFTPNGDGLNDLFKAEGTLMKIFKMQIFSRGGALVFETEDQQAGWDGTTEGMELPSTSYIYMVEAIDVNDKKFNQTGQVVLLRE